MKVFVFSENCCLAGQIANQDAVDDRGEDSPDLLCVFEGSEKEFREQLPIKLELEMIDWSKMTDFGFKWRRSLYKYATGNEIVAQFEHQLPSSTKCDGFDSFVCSGGKLEFWRFGLWFVAKIEHDQDCSIDDDDSHNPDQSVTGCNDEQQAKLLAARKAWHDDEWFYCGVSVECYLGPDMVDKLGDASLWGIEANYPGSDNSYLTQVALELTEQIACELKSKDMRNFADKAMEKAEAARNWLKCC